MKTYLLSGKPADLNTARKGAHYFKRKDRRAVLVKAGKAPPDYLVRHSFSGDESAAVEPDWLRRTIVDDLADEYAAATPVKPRVRRAAVQKLRDAQRAVQDAEKALLRAKERLRAAEAGIVRTHGRKPVIDGVQYTVGHRDESVWLIRVMSKAEVIEAQRRAEERKRAEKIG